MSSTSENSNLSKRIVPEISWFQKRFARQLAGTSGPKDKIDMATAENWLIREDLLEPMKRAMLNLSLNDLSYASGLGGSKGLLTAAAGFFNKFFRARRPVEASQIVAGPGASALLDSLVYCICDEGDTVLVEAPYWGSFEIYCTLRNNVHLKPVYPPQPTPGSPIDQEAYIDAFEQALQETGPKKVKGVLFCNPSNPLAQSSSPESIKSLLQFCRKRSLHFISDEVYGLTAFGEEQTVPSGSNIEDLSVAEADVKASPALHPFVSILEMDLEALGVDANRVHLLHSTSKDLGSSGLRMGFLITTDSALRFNLAILNHNKVSTTTSLITEGLFSDLEELDTIISENRERLSAAAWIAETFLQSRQIEFLKPTAGVYIWARMGGANCSWEREAELTRQFGEQGVSVGNGTDYTAAQAGWFRISFAVPREQFVTGLQRIAAVLDRQDA